MGLVYPSLHFSKGTCLISPHTRVVFGSVKLALCVTEFQPSLCWSTGEQHCGLLVNLSSFPFSPHRHEISGHCLLLLTKRKLSKAHWKGLLVTLPLSPQRSLSHSGCPVISAPLSQLSVVFRSTLRLIIAQALFTLPLSVPTPLSFSLMLLPVWPHPQIRWEGAPPRLTQNKDQRWAGALSRPEEQSQLFSLH